MLKAPRAARVANAVVDADEMNTVLDLRADQMQLPVKTGCNRQVMRQYSRLKMYRAKPKSL
jgi:hypothetical protein